LAAGLLEWRWWRARAIGAHAVLLAGTAISLAVAVLMTNNFGGASVGFRHAVYLSPVFVVWVLPWIAAGSSPRSRAAIVAIACVSTALMLVLAARDPWSELMLSDAPIGTLDQYVPIIGRLVSGNLWVP
jgi:hypothetical protein